MTVKELIEKLKTYPENWPIIVWVEAEVLEDFEYPILGVYKGRKDAKSVDLII